MTDPLERRMVRLHDSPWKLVLACTGGGSRAIVRMLETPGASRTVLEATAPYTSSSLDAWLGARPEQYCSAWTARAMAMAAFERARRWSPEDDPDFLMGVSATCGLASDRPKKGPHRIHLAVQTSRSTVFGSVELVKGRRDRRGEEQVAADLLLNLIAETAGVEPLAESSLQSDEPLVWTRAEASQAQRGLLLGQLDFAAYGPEQPGDYLPEYLFPGAFHPLHAGHCKMADYAAQVLGVRPTFEISCRNVDKPSLDFWDVQSRLAQFSSNDSVYLTHAATFVEKARLFPRAVFVVGVDTITRIVDPKYYCGESVLRDKALRELAAAEARFLVFGRAVDGEFCGLESLSLPNPLAERCQGVPQQDFREDLSSTALRLAERKEAEDESP